MASAMASVRVASGIRMRVKRNRPTQVAIAQARVEAGQLRKSPGGHARRDPAEQDREQRHGEPRGPVMHAEEGEGNGDGPVFEGRFLEVFDAIEARRHPVAGSEHVAGDLGLHSVHVVHQRRRADYGDKKYGGRKENYD